jgi:medium-chain acyl-[acyl-carrier-protein] hydrolase
MTPRLANRLWIPRPSRAASRRLYCFHHAGGTSRTFAPLAYALPPSVELAAIELPGRGLRQHESFFTTFEQVMADLDESWEAWMADGRPFGFLGHSMGAMLAYSYACRLSAQGRSGPDALVVSGTVCPHRFVERNGRLAKLQGREELLAEMQRFNGSPPELLELPDIKEMLLTLIQADFRLCATYDAVSARALACPLLSIGGDADPGVAVTELGAWAEYTRGRFSSRVFRGDHFYVKLNWPEVAKVAATSHCPG